MALSEIEKLTYVRKEISQSLDHLNLLLGEASELIFWYFAELGGIQGEGMEGRSKPHPFFGGRRGRVYFTSE